MIVLGVVGAPHGVKGEVRVKSSTADPLAIGSYGPVTLPDGRRLKVKSVRPGGEVVIVKLEGVNDRTAAEALKFQTLSVPRDRLPPPDDEDDFYHADLIGLRCETADGALVAMSRRSTTSARATFSTSGLRRPAHHARFHEGERAGGGRRWRAAGGGAARRGRGPRRVRRCIRVARPSRLASLAPQNEGTGFCKTPTSSS